MMKTYQDIHATLAKRKPEIQARFHVREIGIFGSFARGEQTRRSDVDILVDFEPEHITFDNHVNLQLYLERLFRRKVDVVRLGAVRKELQPFILREVLYV